MHVECHAGFPLHYVMQRPPIPPHDVWWVRPPDRNYGAYDDEEGLFASSIGSNIVPLFTHQKFDFHICYSSWIRDVLFSCLIVSTKYWYNSLVVDKVQKRQFYFHSQRDVICIPICPPDKLSDDELTRGWRGAHPFKQNQQFSPPTLARPPSPPLSRTNYTEMRLILCKSS